MSEHKELTNIFFHDQFALPKTKVFFVTLAAIFSSISLLLVIGFIIFTPAFGFKKSTPPVELKADMATGYPVTFIKNKPFSVGGESTTKEAVQTLEIKNSSAELLKTESKNIQTVSEGDAKNSLENETIEQVDDANNQSQNPEPNLTSQTSNHYSAGNSNTKKRISPVYPQFALTRNIEGYVVAEYTINIDGSASQMVIIESEPKNVFDAAVLKAIKNFKHSPNKINGKAVAVIGVRNRFEFKLNN